MYVLHYAPDNASLVVRLVLEEMGQPYRTVLVDRASRQQDSAAFLALNPAGLIPVLETPEGPLSETGAIVLWLSETHRMLGPQPGHADRGSFLRVLFFIANTLHADLRMVFYPEQYAGDDPRLQRALHDAVTARVLRHFALLEGEAVLTGEPSLLQYYVAVTLRWAQVYARLGTAWFDLSAFPNLAAMAGRLESRGAVQRAVIAEGLGQKPFSAPVPCHPPEGSALG